VTGTSYCAGGGLDRASDPWVAFAPNGDLYHVSLLIAVDANDAPEFHALVPPVLPAQPNENGIAVSKSTDGGRSWGAPIEIVHARGGGLNDKESVTADPHDSRLVYVVWDRVDAVQGQALFARTTDAGATWSLPAVVYDPGSSNSTVGHQILVAPDGTLYNFFTEIVLQRAPSGAFVTYFLSFVRSYDQGVTWSGVARAFPFAPAVVADPDQSIPIRSSGVLMDVAIDPASGTLYAAWGDGGGFGPPTSVMAATSSDGGITWRQTIVSPNTSAVGQNGQAFTPTVRVAADGTVGISYYDFHDNGAELGALASVRLVLCRPSTGEHCASPRDWSQVLTLTDAPFDFLRAPFARGLFLGDYEGLVTDGGDFLALFSIVDHGNARVVFRRARPWRAQGAGG
jgi:hypothetical protein